MAPNPMARRAVKPVPTPKSMRPGASRLSEASALAVTGAMRFDGTNTPVPRRIRRVLTAAAAMATKQAEFLGPADDVVGVRRRWQRDAEIHHVTSLCRSANIWVGYATFITFFGQSMQDCPYLEKTSTAGLGFGHAVAIICLSALWIWPIAKND
jgi:hypothetical protein